MVFSSYVFLCLLLPVTLVLHILIRNIRVRNALLIVASLIFYTCGEPAYSVVLLVSVVLNYLFGMAIGAAKHKKPLLAFALLINIAILFVFKYLGFALTEINKFLDATQQIPVPAIKLPIGISFYTFQAMSYLVDVYRGETRSQRNFARLLLYISFFPQLVAGPIVKYKDIEQQLNERNADSTAIRNGMLRFSAGLGKKILIANMFAKIADDLYALDISGVAAMTAWVASLSYCVQIYFDFSGYSDMALGLGQMFGFKFPENFNYPYISLSVREFWRRWHISLSSWFRDYLYIPLGGNRKGWFRTIINNYIVFIVTGIWHGAAWTFLGFGIWHGNFMMLERIKFFPFGKGKIHPLNWLYTMMVVNIGFIFMRAESLEKAFGMIKALFLFQSGSFDATVATMSYFTPFYIVLFVIAVLAATGLPHKIYTAVNTRAAGFTAFVSMLFSLAILAICFMQLAADSYNPFIYFRF